MMRYALTQGTRICQIEDETFPVHKDLIWVDVADDTSTEDTYENGAVVKKPAPTEEEIAMSKIISLETIPRRIRENLIALGTEDQVVIDEDAAIAVQRELL
jgi:hypothetical protein